MSKFGTRESLVERTLRRNDVTLNYEGGLAFFHDAKHTLAYMAACSLVNEESFYGDTTDEIDSLIYKVANEDPEWLLKLAVYLRQELHLRSMPVKIAAIAATLPECRPYLLKAGKRIMARPDDLLEFVALLKDSRHGLSESLPHAAKKIARGLLDNIDEIRALKYRRAEGFGMKHVLKLCHPKPDSIQRQAIFSYLSGSRWSLMSDDMKQSVPRIAAYESLKRTSRHNHQRIRHLIRKAELPWEMVLPVVGTSKETWRALVPVMPVMALTRNLRNLVESGALQSHVTMNQVIDKLTDPEIISNSKMLPFRWPSARKVLNDLALVPAMAVHARCIQKLQEALSKAVELSASCLEKLPGKTVIACDLSGSMSCTPISQYSSIYPADIACVLASMARYLCEEARVYAFATRVALLRTDRGYGLLGDAEDIRRIDVGEATYGYKVFENLVKRQIYCDRIIVLTDMQMYSPDDQLTDRYDVRYWLKRYQRHVNSQVKTYFVDLQPYSQFITPQDESGVTNISGWSEGILKYIAVTSSGFDIVEETDGIAL